jgi:dynein heavy chain
MVTMIMDGDDQLNKMELDFFLKGNTSLDVIEEKKPYPWLSDNGWKDIQKFETLGDVWKDFKSDLKGNGKEWKEWYDLEAPEACAIPCDYSAKLSKYQQLCLMRVIRPDRCIPAIKNFIIDKMSDYYVKPQPLNYEKIYA